MGVTLTKCAEAVLYNGLARYEDAFLAASVGFEDPHELWFWPWVAVELIEAASRTGRSAVALPPLNGCVRAHRQAARRGRLQLRIDAMRS